MDLLDAPLSSPPATPLWGTIARYGPAAGVVYILAAQIIYRLGISLVTINGIIVSALTIVLTSAAVAFLAIRHQRDRRDGGYISWGKALMTGLLCVFTGFLLMTFWNYLFMNYMEPEYLENMKQDIKDQYAGHLNPDELSLALANVDRIREYTTILRNSIQTEMLIGSFSALVVSFFMARRFQNPF